MLERYEQGNSQTLILVPMIYHLKIIWISEGNVAALRALNTGRCVGKDE